MAKTPAAKKNFSLSVDKTTARKASALGGTADKLEISPSSFNVSGGVPYNRNLEELVAVER